MNSGQDVLRRMTRLAVALAVVTVVVMALVARAATYGVTAPTKTVTGTDQNTSTPDATTPTSDQNVLSPTTTDLSQLTFAVEATDATTYSGEIAFVASGTVGAEQLIVFVRASDGVVIRQLPLEPSPTRDRWQGVLDTTTLSNGIY